MGDTDRPVPVYNRTRGEWVAAIIFAFLGGAFAGTLAGVVYAAVRHGLTIVTPGDGGGGAADLLPVIGLLAVSVGSVGAVLAGALLRPRDVSGRRRPGAGGTPGLAGDRNWRSHFGPDGELRGSGADAAVDAPAGVTPDAD